MSGVMRISTQNDLLKTDVTRLLKEIENKNKRIAKLEELLIEEYNYGTLERKDIERLVPKVLNKNGGL